MSISVEVSNLGPLRSAEVELADLTVLIGDNNTGKTFFATVLHRVLSAADMRSSFAGRLGRRLPDEVRDWFEIWLETLSASPSNPESTLEQPSREVLQWASQITTARLESFGADIRNGVEYAYGVEASDLRRRTPSRRSSDCYVRVRNAEPKWDVEVRFDSDVISVNPPDPVRWLQRLLEEETVRLKSEPDATTRGRVRRRSLIRQMTSGYFIDLPPSVDLFPGWPSFPVHLPANRTGIMQSYQVLAGAVVRRSATAGIRAIEIDPLPGTSADFLSLLLADPDAPYVYRRENPRFRALIKDLEHDLRAEMSIEERANSLDSVLAVTPEGAFPLSRTSSMLSELAPLLLVLKGAVGRADHLTIDEPEAHLHPAMQRRIATFIADVVDRGFPVVLTTHSDFFLGEINNLIRASKLVDSKSVAPLDGRSNRAKSTVCAQRFVREERWCRGLQLVIDPIDGIDESTFTEVMESLYDDSAELINELL